MLLCANLGNTSLQLGVFELEGPPVEVVNLDVGERPSQSVAGIRRLLAGRRPEATVVASVSPPALPSVLNALREAGAGDALIIGKDVKSPIEVLCERPENVGVDRLMNATAAYRHARSACIVVDAGTAVTVDLVTHEGAFAGGAILPGPKAWIKGLAHAAAQLPEIQFTPGQSLEVQSVVGRNTRDAIQAGLTWGLPGAIECVVQQMRAEVGGTLPVIGTGGAIEDLQKRTTCIPEIVPALTIIGIRLTWEMRARGSRGSGYRGETL